MKNATNPARLYIGTMHERPELLPLNQELKRRGSEWRVTTCKAIGLCIWHPGTQVYRAVDDDGFVMVPDISDDAPLTAREPERLPKAKPKRPKKADPKKLLPCPFCGGEVKLEEAASTHCPMMGRRRWWGVVCRNSSNVGGSCAIFQRPSASEETAIKRWNMRNGKLPLGL